MSQNLSGSRSIILFLLASAILLILIYLSPRTKEESSVSIQLGVTKWPGFEYLFVAKKQDFFSQVNIDIELVELSSLAEVRRAFERGKIDAMAATLVEVLEAYKYSGNIAQPILVTDYSKGADEILSAMHVKNIKDLKGKKIGLEAGSMSTYILYCALDINEIDNSEVVLVPMERHKLAKALKAGKVDAITSYPPNSIKVKKELDVNVIFDSSQIPHKLLNVIAVNNELLIDNPNLQDRFRSVWKLTLDYVNNNQKAYEILTERLHISIDEFKKSMELIQLIDASDQEKYFNKDGIIKDTLIKTGEIVFMNSKQEDINLSEFIYQSEAR